MLIDDVERIAFALCICHLVRRGPERFASSWREVLVGFVCVGLDGFVLGNRDNEGRVGSTEDIRVMTVKDWYSYCRVGHVTSRSTKSVRSTGRMIRVLDM